MDKLERILFRRHMNKRLLNTGSGVNPATGNGVSASADFAIVGDRLQITLTSAGGEEAGIDGVQYGTAFKEPNVPRGRGLVVHHSNNRALESAYLLLMGSGLLGPLAWKM